MSYGVMGSKNGQLLIQSTGLGGKGSDAALDAFQQRWGAQWVGGRLMLSKLHLTFLPTKVSAGSGMLKLSTEDVTGIEVSGGVMSKTMTLRTATHLVQFRCTGADKMADQIAEAARTARAGSLGRRV
ncbi:hypothetical protein [Nocardioides sp. GY 10127]|uniref:hypothetical protein n=1 Tax=Nocardioides sp. GY 10127 TaxID=2569762 RepID=UPI0010A7EA98|nr:hypothetical protein [Nocardioides sp. GY 10127]TIC82740.1 hypothetical protein E8D37_08605 [Nocardioides sp. GY 10127]